MLTAIRMTVSLLKLRIGSAVAASALAGIAAANGPALA
jgi:heme o synthase